MRGAAGEEFGRLASLLRQQHEVVREQVAAAEEQSEALRTGDMEGLGRAVRRQAALSARMARLEEERQELQARLEATLGLPGGSRLRDMLPYAPPVLREELDGVGREMRKDIELLAEVNRLNRDLTLNALRFTRFMLRVLQPGSGTYTRDGTVPGGAGGGLIDESV